MKYVLKKSITLIITLLFITFFTFIAFEIIPGDSVLSSLGMDASKEQIEALREELGYNDPLILRFGGWLGRTISGDFGVSTSYGIRVGTLIGERMPITLGLGIISIVLILIFSFPLGIFTTIRKRTRTDGVFHILTQLGMAIPPFFLGILITLFFGIMLRLFTPGVYVPMSESFTGYLNSLLFPALAIAIPKAAMVARFLRTSMLRQLSLDYVRTAKSKGNNHLRILLVHVLRNALMPVITCMSMIIADVMAGSMSVEQVFNLPGLGRLLVSSISARDFPVVQVIIMYMASVILIMNFIVDIIYKKIDPRVTI